MESIESRENIDLELRRYLLTVKRRWVPAVSIFVITVTLSALSTVFLKPSYQAEGKLMFKLDRTSSLTGLGENSDDLKPLVSTQNPISSEIEVIYSNQLLQKTIEILNLKDDRGKLLDPEDIKNKLSAKLVGGTDVLKLSYKSSDPKEAAAVVNRVMSLYIEDYIRADRGEATAAREFIAKQLPFTESNVRAAEAALRRFKEQNNVIELSKEAESAVTKIQDLDGQITTVQADLEEENARSVALRNTLRLNSQDATTVSALSQSPGVQKLLEELQAVERQIATDQSRFQEQSPTLSNLRARQASLKALLQNEIGQIVGSQEQVPDKLLQINSLVGEQGQNLITEFVKSEVKRLSLSRRLTSLNQSRYAYVQRANILPQLEQQQRELEQRLEASQSTYETLLKKLQEVQVAQNKDISSVRIIDPAIVPKKPNFTTKLMILGLGVLLGAFLSTTTVFFLEMGDRISNNQENHTKNHRRTLSSQESKTKTKVEW